MQNIECWMILNFRDNLSLQEKQYCDRWMSVWQIYKSNDGKYRSRRDNQKGSLFMFTAGIEREMKSIIHKIKELKIHYGEFEDDLVKEWTEKRIWVNTNVG